jgi:MFS family permease
MMLIFGPVSGVMTRRLGARVPIVAGSAACCLSFTLPAVDHARMWQLLACGVGSGIGLGLAYAALPNAIIAHVRPEQVGIATGVNTLARSVGSSIGAAVVAAILAAHAGLGGTSGNAGYTIGFAVCAVMFGLGGAAALLIPSVRGMGDSDAAPRGQAAAMGSASAFPYGSASREAKARPRRARVTMSAAARSPVACPAGGRVSLATDARVSRFRRPGAGEKRGEQGGDP